MNYATCARWICVEIEGILDRAQDRMNAVLTPDQRERLRQMLEERKQRLEQWFNVPEP